MTPALARRFALWALVAWGVSVVLLLLFGDYLAGPAGGAVARPRTRPDLAAAVSAVLLAAATVLLLSWVTSMVAGPFALVKMRDRPNTLGVYRTIILPLSLAVGLVCAIAFPVKWNAGCDSHRAVVPLVTVPLYLLSDPDQAPVAYLRIPTTDGCSGV